jgi:hypothetical protein
VLSRKWQTTNDWRVEATVAEVYSILEDTSDLGRWWSSVYFDVKVLEPARENGMGKRISLKATGWLPYILSLEFVTTEKKEDGFTVKATGELEGTGVWKFEQDGAFVNITFDWTVIANKPIIEKLSFLLKPIFRSNHNWTMRRGEESLKLELLRRRAKTREEVEKIPPPPKPFFIFRNRNS